MSKSNVSSGDRRYQAGTRGFKRLAVLNRRIVRLSSELETLQYMQDRLERELEPGGNVKKERDVSSSPRRTREPLARGRRG